METIRALLVEDNPGDARLIQEMMKTVGGGQCILDVAQRLTEGLTKLENNNFQVTLLDLGLPDSYGFDTFLRLHNRLPRMPVVVLTDLRDDVLALRAVREGAQDYLVKGYIDADILLRTIRYAIERKRAEEGLQRSEERKDAILKSALDAIITIDHVGKIVEFNPAAERMFGHRREEVMGKEMAELIIPSNLREQHRRGLRNYLATGEGPVLGKRIELTAIRADSSEFPVEVSSVCVKGEPPPMFTGFIRDITERKRAEEALRKSHDELETQVEERTTELKGANEALLAEVVERKQAEEKIKKLNEDLERRALELEAANKELEAFSYSVSHDLRAPLRHIDGFADLLHKHAASQLDDKARRFLNTISDSAKKMGNLIDELLVFSRMGRTEIRSTTVNLEELVKEIVHGSQQDLEGRRVDWSIGPLPHVYADRSLLRQVLVNLISNAVKYTRPREQARVEIGCTAEGDEIVFFVRDNGVGFDMKYVYKLYGIFQRLHRSDEFEGTGIGLANVRRIIHRHGGRTWAEGTVDGGATFYFSLPRSTQTVRQDVPQEHHAV